MQTFMNPAFHKTGLDCCIKVYQKNVCEILIKRVKVINDFQTYYNNKTNSSQSFCSLAAIN